MKKTNHRNFKRTDYFGTVEHIYENKKRRTNNAIITVAAETYRFIRNNNYKLYIGYQCCRAYGDINIRPCVKCGRIGHSGKVQKRKCLPICAGDHLTKNCLEKKKQKKKKKIKCTNCCYENKKYNL